MELVVAKFWHTKTCKVHISIRGFFVRSSVIVFKLYVTKDCEVTQELTKPGGDSPPIACNIGVNDKDTAHINIIQG